MCFHLDKSENFHLDDMDWFDFVACRFIALFFRRGRQMIDMIALIPFRKQFVCNINERTKKNH